MTFSIRIYNSRNYSILLNFETRACDKMEIYNSRNYSILLNFTGEGTLDSIYNSRNYSILLNLYFDASGSFNLQQ